MFVVLSYFSLHQRNINANSHYIKEIFMQIQTRKEANHEIKRYTFSLHLFLIFMLKNPVFYVFL